MDVIKHFENLKQSREHLNLYALVDGLGYDVAADRKLSH